jgi:hypothetical protein
LERARAVRRWSTWTQHRTRASARSIPLRSRRPKTSPHPHHLGLDRDAEGRCSLTHRNLVNLAAPFLDSYRPGPEDRILPLTALGFASFVGEIYPLLCAGGGASSLPNRAELLEVGLTALIARHGTSPSSRLCRR